jgi:hypothetical protein
MSREGFVKRQPCPISIYYQSIHPERLKKTMKNLIYIYIYIPNTSKKHYCCTKPVNQSESVSITPPML